MTILDEMFVIPQDVPSPLIPLSWLLGRWEGEGVVAYPTMDKPIRFRQEVDFSHDGRPFLYYSSRSTLIDDDGEVLRPGGSETGFWRVPAVTDPEADAKKGPGVDVEVLLTHPTGFVEVYVGRATGARVDLTTDVVARTATAKEYNAGQRMYGSVEGDLLWVMDMAAMGQEMTSHLSARLHRVAVTAVDELPTQPQAGDGS